jgi:Putative auto-transporter adhesin, head GIN domain
MMKSFLLNLVLICLSFYSFGQSKELTPFTGVKTSGGLSVELISGPNPKAEYTITRGSEKDLIIEVEDGILIIKPKGNRTWNSNTTNLKANVRVYFQNITSVNVSSGSNISSRSTISAKDFNVGSSSGSSCTLILDANDIIVNSSSGSSINLSGSAYNATYETSSGSSISAQGLKAVKVDAEASSGSTLSVYASESIAADASSGGSIKYKGSPKSKNISSGNMSGGSVSGN